MTINASLVYPPQGITFYTLLLRSKQSLFLLSPYIKLDLAQKITDYCINNPLIELTVITSLTSKNYLSSASDLESLEIMLKSLSNVSIISVQNLHAKVYIFDSKSVLITSANLTSGGMKENIEIGVLIENRDAITELHRKYLDTYKRLGYRVHLEDILNIKQKVKEFLLKNKTKIDQLEKLDNELNIPIFIKASKIIQSVNQKLDTRIESLLTSKSIYKESKLIIPKKWYSISKDKPNIEDSSLTYNIQNYYPNIDEDWLLHYVNLQLFRERNNNRFWPGPNDIVNGVHLGEWVNIQRKKFKTKLLAKAEEKLLKDIGFDFDRKSSFWYHHFQILLDYRQENPGEWPNTRVVYKDVQLGKWCKNLRTSTGVRKHLTEEQRAMLTAVGFEWDVFKAYWTPTLKLLKKYKERYYPKWPQKGELFDGYDLYTWCVDIRRKKSKLGPKYIQELNSIGFVW